MDLRRIRLDSDGLIIQDPHGFMRRIPLPPVDVDVLRADPSALGRMSAQHSCLAGFLDGRPAAVPMELAVEPTACLSRPLRIYYGVEPHCNLLCEGCGPRDFGHRSVRVSRQFEEFLLRQIAASGAFQVQLTGGEIATRGRDLFAVLDLARDLRLAVLLATNGVWSEIKDPDDFAAQLAGYDNIIQTNISIDGTLAAHEHIRGEGTYAETIATLERLSRFGLKPRITSTVFQFNCNSEQLNHLVALARRYNAGLQVIPVRLTGRATGHRDQMPTRLQLRDYTALASRLRIETGVALSFNFDVFENPRPVPMFDLHRPISCGAPLWGVHVTHTGEVYPCGFVQTAVGNGTLLAGRVSEGVPLLDIWLHSEVLHRIRHAGKSAACTACDDYGRGCWGGCWVAAWVETGELNGMDPYCFKQYDDRPDQMHQIQPSSPLPIFQ